MPPSRPRRISRPIWLPTVRAVCLAMVSIMPWRRLVPNNASFITSPMPIAVVGLCGARRLVRCLGVRLDCDAACGEHLRRRFAVDRVVVLAAHPAAGAHLPALGVGAPPHADAGPRRHRLS